MLVSMLKTSFELCGYESANFVDACTRQSIVAAQASRSKRAAG